MLLPEKEENQRLANISRTSTTPPLEVDSNYDLEVNSFHPGSTILRQHQLVTSRQRQSISLHQPEFITPLESQLDTPFLPALLHHSYPIANSKNPTCSDNENGNDFVSDCSHLTSLSRLGVLFFSGM